ncbi:MAG: 3-isopropylmalate dehydratase small subunit [Candidatus Omnitrophica bacterium]|nr:3-isopropylmalate dehydratase small subunit [Candidatus Omnitrophota bacterium]
MIYKGRVHKFGDDVNTDLILPARHMVTTDKAELARHCMEDADKNFAKKVKAGDIIVAGKNFGCGSSREHAPVAIKACGISCVIAESFARIFFRNSINIGLPIVESKEASKEIRNNDVVKVDTKTGVIKNLKTKKKYRIGKYPPFMERIINSGGLMNSIKKRTA